MPSIPQLCFTRRILLFGAVNWAAIVAWAGSVNWVAASTTAGVVIFNVTLGIMAAVGHVKAQRLKWRKEEETAMKDSLLKQIQDNDRKATEERAELLATIQEKDKRLAEVLTEMQRITASIAKERESIHAQRGEYNAASLAQINESTELRKQLREISQELAQTRRELWDAKNQTQTMADETIAKVNRIVTNNAPEESKS